MKESERPLKGEGEPGRRGGGEVDLVSAQTDQGASGRVALAPTRLLLCLIL